MFLSGAVIQLWIIAKILNATLPFFNLLAFGCSIESLWEKMMGQKTYWFPYFLFFSGAFPRLREVNASTALVGGEVRRVEVSVMGSIVRREGGLGQCVRALRVTSFIFLRNRTLLKTPTPSPLLTAIRHNEPLIDSLSLLLLSFACAYSSFLKELIVGPDLIAQHAMVLNHIHGDMGSCLHVLMTLDPTSPLLFSLFLFNQIFLRPFRCCGWFWILDRLHYGLLGMYFHFVVGLGCPPTVHIIYNMLKKLFINWVLQWSPLKFLESPLKLKQLICFIVGCSAKLIYIYIYIFNF